MEPVSNRPAIWAVTSTHLAQQNHLSNNLAQNKMAAEKSFDQLQPRNEDVIFLNVMEGICWQIIYILQKKHGITASVREVLGDQTVPLSTLRPYTVSQQPIFLAQTTLGPGYWNVSRLLHDMRMLFPEQYTALIADHAQCCMFFVRLHNMAEGIWQISVQMQDMLKDKGLDKLSEQDRTTILDFSQQLVHIRDAIWDDYLDELREKESQALEALRRMGEEDRA